jgi:DNA-binding NarL/FixJ family response regulator
VLQRDAPALVVSDLRLPDGDGLSIVRAARALPIPAMVIVITGFGSASIWQSAQEAGASAYLAKPFSVHAFTRARRSAAGRRRRWATSTVLRP